MELDKIRERIDKVDEQLLPLFLERMELAAQAGSYKASHGLPVRNRSREEQILERISERAGELAPYACKMYEAIFGLALDYETALSGSEKDSE